MGVFTRDFIDIGSGGHSMACSMAGSTGGQIMYSLLCQNILSDLDDHKRARAKEEDNPRDTNPGIIYYCHTQVFYYASDGIIYYVFGLSTCLFVSLVILVITTIH